MYGLEGQPREGAICLRVQLDGDLGIRRGVQQTIDRCEGVGWGQPRLRERGRQGHRKRASGAAFEADLCDDALRLLHGHVLDEEAHEQLPLARRGPWVVPEAGKRVGELEERLAFRRAETDLILVALLF